MAETLTGSSKLGIRWRPWRPLLGHPLLQLELNRIRRKRWWPGRRFFLYYPVLLGSFVGCIIALLVNWPSGVQVAAFATGLPVVCLLSVVSWLLNLALTWIIPALTAVSIAREQELGTFDILRATLLSEQSIVLGKLGSSLFKLWPAILTLALLMPFQLLSPIAGSASFSLTLLPVLEPTTNTSWWIVEMIILVIAGLIHPWSRLMLHATIGLFVSVLCRSSATAIIITYGSILTTQAALWLGNMVLSSTITFTLLDPTMTFQAMMVGPLLSSWIMLLVEIVSSVLLVLGSIWRMKRL